MLETVTPTDWEEALDRWLEPLLDRLQRAEQRHWAPLYMEGLLRPAERTSVTRLAERACPDDSRQLHHFVGASPWDRAPGGAPCRAGRSPRP